MILVLHRQAERLTLLSEVLLKDVATVLLIKKAMYPMVLLEDVTTIILTKQAMYLMVLLEDLVATTTALLG